LALIKCGHLLTTFINWCHQWIVVRVLINRHFLWSLPKVLGFYSFNYLSVFADVTTEFRISMLTFHEIRNTCRFIDFLLNGIINFFLCLLRIIMGFIIVSWWLLVVDNCCFTCLGLRYPNFMGFSIITLVSCFSQTYLMSISIRYVWNTF